MRPRISISGSVHPSIRLSVHPSVGPLRLLISSSEHRVASIGSCYLIVECKVIVMDWNFHQLDICAFLDDEDER